MLATHSPQWTPAVFRSEPPERRDRKNAPKKHLKKHQSASQEMFCCKLTACWFSRYICNTCAYCKEGSTNGTTNLLRQALGSSSNPSSSNDHEPPYPHQKSHDMASQATTRSCLLLILLGSLWLWINKLSSEVFTADLLYKMQAACTNKTWWCWIFYKNLYTFSKHIHFLYV